MQTRLPIALAALALALALPAASAVAKGTPKDPSGDKAMAGMLMPKGHGDVQLAIVRSRKGGYGWRDGRRTSATAHVIMPRGRQLVLVNESAAYQRLVQTAGPRVALPGPMRSNHGAILVLAKAGAYRFRTKAYVMKRHEADNGMPGMLHAHPVTANGLLLIVQVT